MDILSPWQERQGAIEVVDWAGRGMEKLSRVESRIAYVLVFSWCDAFTAGPWNEFPLRGSGTCGGQRVDELVKHPPLNDQTVEIDE